MVLWNLCLHATTHDLLLSHSPLLNAMLFCFFPFPNPPSLWFGLQSFRTRLIPGMLKTIAHNRDTPMPLKLFEVSDVVVVDPSVETGARNHRKVILAHVGTTSNLTMIHGMVDRLMVCLGEVDYRVEQQPEETREPFFLPERAMSVVFKGATVGSFGIIHPHVLRNFEIVYPVSLLEISLAPFL